MINSIESQPKSDDIEQVGYETSIQSLPAEILNYIFSFLPHCSLVAAEGVCRPWKAITQYNWKKLCLSKPLQDFTVIKEDMDTNWKTHVMKFSAHSATHFLANPQNTQLQAVSFEPVLFNYTACLDHADNLKIFKSTSDKKTTLQIYEKNDIAFYLKTDKIFYFASNWLGGSRGRVKLYKFDLGREVEVSANYKQDGMIRFIAAKGEYVIVRIIDRRKRKIDQFPKRFIKHTLIHFSEDSASEIVSFVSASSQKPPSLIYVSIKKNKVFYQDHRKSKLIVYDIEKNSIHSFEQKEAFLFYFHNVTKYLDCTDNCYVFFPKRYSDPERKIEERFVIQFFEQTRHFSFSACDYHRFSDWLVLKVRHPVDGYQIRAYHEAFFYNLIKNWPKQKLAALTSFQNINLFEKDLCPFKIESSCYYIFQNVLCEQLNDRNAIKFTCLPEATVLKIVSFPEFQYTLLATKFQRSKDKKSLFMIWTLNDSGVSKSYRARIL